MGEIFMFVRAELKRRAKEVLSRKYLKLFVACLLLYWLGNGIGNFKIFQINFNFSGPTAQWLDAMTITLFGKTYSGLSSLMTLFGPLVLMYTLLSAAVAALIRLIVLNPLSFGLMNYMKNSYLFINFAEKLKNIDLNFQNLFDRFSRIFKLKNSGN